MKFLQTFFNASAIACIRWSHSLCLSVNINKNLKKNIMYTLHCYFLIFRLHLRQLLNYFQSGALLQNAE